MMKNNEISQDRSLWQYLEHYATERAINIQSPTALLEEENLSGGIKDENYSASLLKEYFGNDKNK